MIEDYEYRLEAMSKRHIAKVSDVQYKFTFFIKKVKTICNTQKH